jgi:cell division protein FtsB
MAGKKMQAEKKTAERAGGAIPGRALEWTLHLWRPAGTVVAVGLALLLTWHVINGKHGLQVWQQMRGEDRQLQRDINDLERENAGLKERIERLKSDPESMAILAREKLHYTKPNEVIVTLPPAAQAQTPPAGGSR